MAVLRGIDAELQPSVPEGLQRFIGGATTWAGPAFELQQLQRALEELATTGLVATQGDVVTWDANDELRIDINIGLPLLLLARDLRALGREGTLEVGGA